MSYGNNFRQCVLDNISEGMSWSKACKIFSINRGSIASWLKKVQTTGEVSDSPLKVYKLCKIDSDLLLVAFDKTLDATLEGIVKQFNYWPQSIHQRCVGHNS